MLIPVIDLIGDDGSSASLPLLVAVVLRTGVFTGNISVGVTVGLPDVEDAGLPGDIDAGLLGECDMDGVAFPLLVSWVEPKCEPAAEVVTGAATSSGTADDDLVADATAGVAAVAVLPEIDDVVLGVLVEAVLAAGIGTSHFPFPVTVGMALAVTTASAPPLPGMVTAAADFPALAAVTVVAPAVTAGTENTAGSFTAVLPLEAVAPAASAAAANVEVVDRMTPGPAAAAAAVLGCFPLAPTPVLLLLVKLKLAAPTTEAADTVAPAAPVAETVALLADCFIASACVRRTIIVVLSLE